MAEEAAVGSVADAGDAALPERQQSEQECVTPGPRTHNSNNVNVFINSSPR